jgi:hypothetical protein
MSCLEGPRCGYGRDQVSGIIELTASKARPEMLSEPIGTQRRRLLVVAEMPWLLLDDGGRR